MTAARVMRVVLFSLEGKVPTILHLTHPCLEVVEGQVADLIFQRIKVHLVSQEFGSKEEFMMKAGSRRRYGA